MLKPSLEDFEHNRTNMGDECNCPVIWIFFSTPFLGIGIRIGLFQSCCHCLVFQICWHTECNTLIASSFRMLISSSGIPSPPLALLAAVLPKAHLTSHSRMLGSGWATTPLRLSGSLRSFLYSSSVYSCHLFLISSASIESLPQSFCSSAAAHVHNFLILRASAGLWTGSFVANLVPNLVGT